MKNWARRISPSMVVATAALVMAIGSGAWALEGRNSVNSGDVKNNSLDERDLAKNSVGPSELIGEEGPLIGYVNEGQFTVPAGAPLNGEIQCEQGDMAVSGGYNTGAPAPDQQNLEASLPLYGSSDSSPDGWIVVLYNKTDAPITNEIFVVCLKGVED